MARQPAVEPTVHEADGSMGRHLTHPAFGFIEASRISGRVDNLFGSQVDHLGFVRLSIHGARQYDDGYHQREMPDAKCLAEVWMTESQWVGLVSRMNTQGVPCTLRFRPTGIESVPELPPQAIGRERVAAHADAMADRLDTQVAESVKSLAAYASKLGKRDAEAYLRALDVFASNLRANAVYARKVLADDGEKMVHEAKVEVEAFVAGVTTRLGIQSLRQLAALAPPDPDTEPKP